MATDQITFEVVKASEDEAKEILEEIRSLSEDDLKIVSHKMISGLD